MARKTIPISITTYFNASAGQIKRAKPSKIAKTALYMPPLKFEVV